jgi:hypothetical protein
MVASMGVVYGLARYVGRLRINAHNDIVYFLNGTVDYLVR